MDLEHDVLHCLCLNLRRGARQLTQRYDAALRGTGLKITQFQLLAAIDRMKRTTVTPLAGFMGMDRTTLTRNLALLERDGLVRLEQGVQDRREQWITLSPRGRKALTAATPLWEVAQKEILAQLGQAEAERLLRTVARIAQP